MTTQTIALNSEWTSISTGFDVLTVTVRSGNILVAVSGGEPQSTYDAHVVRKGDPDMNPVYIVRRPVWMRAAGPDYRAEITVSDG